MIAPMTLLITVLAVARLTRVITTDYIMQPFRFWVLQKSGDDGWWTYLTNCPYCMSVWVAGGAAPLYWFYGNTPWYLIPALVLAFAEMTILLKRAEG